MKLSHLKEWLERLFQQISPPIDVEDEREKQIWKFDCRWIIQNDALCRIVLPSGNQDERIMRDDLAEVWLVNTNKGALLEVLCTDGNTNNVEGKLVSNDVRDWFFSLDGFDHETFLQHKEEIGYWRTLLWRRLPLAWLGSDAWVLTSLLLFEMKPITLAELISAADWLNHAIPTAYEVNHALTLLSANGYSTMDAKKNIRLTDKAEAFKSGEFQKAKHFSKVEVVLRNLMQSMTVPCSTVKEYFTDDDMTKAHNAIKQALKDYTKSRRKKPEAKK